MNTTNFAPSIFTNYSPSSVIIGNSLFTIIFSWSASVSIDFLATRKIEVSLISFQIKRKELLICLFVCFPFSAIQSEDRVDQLNLMDIMR